MSGQHRLILFIFFMLAIVVAGGMALYALCLLIVGVPTTVVYEAPSPPSLVYMPYPAASLPLMALAFIITGLVTQRIKVAWLGWAVPIQLAFCFQPRWGISPLHWLAVNLASGD